MKISELDRFVLPPALLILAVILLAALMLLMPFMKGMPASAFGDGTPPSALLPR